MNWLKPFFTALQFLTILPVRPASFSADSDEKTIGTSLLYYPLIGLVIGVILVGIAWSTRGMPASLSAALVLTGWVVLTGALHLDGLADSADAWVGGLGDREKTLKIMKDPVCGPMGVVALALLLLLKFTTLELLLSSQYWLVLIIAPTLGRLVPILFFLTTPYVRAHGLGTAFKHHLPRRESLGVVALTLVATILLLGLSAGWLLLALAGLFAALRRLSLKRLNGTTGDTIGASIEITEWVILFALAIIQ